MKYDREKQIGEDFQGWPICKMTYREILEDLGFKHENSVYSLPDDSELLDKFPLCLEDDGMGYGVNDKFVICVNPDGNIFIDSVQKGFEK